MKDLDSKTEDKYPQWEYEELVDSMGVKVLHSVDIGQYEGDTMSLVKEGCRYGLLVYGWGSCSGCDAAQGCRTVKEATELRDQIWNEIHWEDSKKSMHKYISDKDLALEWYGTLDDKGEVAKFIDKILELTS